MKSDSMVIPMKNKPVKYLYGNIKSFLTNAAGTNRSEIQRWIGDQEGVNRFYENIKKEQSVYTLLTPKKTKKISTLFFAPKIIDSKESVVALHEVIDGEERGILIHGRLGQGKSMLLRYLQFMELNLGSTIPIFLELRKIKNPTEIIDQAWGHFKNLGMGCSFKLFEFLLGEGKFSLFLDGFDEISFGNRNDFNEQLSRLREKYPATKILVTSRFNTEVSTNPKFKNLEIGLLEQNDHALFIKKIMGEGEECSALLAKIKESDDFDFTVLDTPLMLTWFIMVYQKRFKIPRTKLGFYEDLFSAILSRHDGLKESYNRPSKSKLPDDEIKKTFGALCYLTRRDQKRSFLKEELIFFIRKALNTVNNEKINADDYFYDLTHVTCLIKEDGFEYVFVHESVQQYFSAFFVSISGDSNAETFYKGRLGEWQAWEGELSFLEKVDSLRFNQFYLIPEMRSSLGGGYENRVITKRFLDMFLASSHIVTIEDLRVLIFVPIAFGKYYYFNVVFSNGLIDPLKNKINKYLSSKVLSSEERCKSMFDFFESECDEMGNNFKSVKITSLIEFLGCRDEFFAFVYESVFDLVYGFLSSAEKVLEDEKSREGIFE